MSGIALTRLAFGPMVSLGPLGPTSPLSQGPGPRGTKGAKASLISAIPLTSLAARKALKYNSEMYLCDAYVSNRKLALARGTVHLASYHRKENGYRHCRTTKALQEVELQ